MKGGENPNKVPFLVTHNMNLFRELYWNILLNDFKDVIKQFPSSPDGQFVMVCMISIADVNIVTNNLYSGSLKCNNQKVNKRIAANILLMVFQNGTNFFTLHWTCR
jgi:hypothetical protein